MRRYKAYLALCSIAITSKQVYRFMHVHECTFIMIWIQRDMATAVVYMINNNEVHNSIRLFLSNFLAIPTVDSVSCQEEPFTTYNLSTVETSRAEVCPSTERMREAIREDV